MKNLKFIIPLFLLLFVFNSCSDNDDQQVLETQTIADLASASPNLSSLVSALQRADLVTTLAGDGPFTVLAPTNDAFDTFLAANNFDSLDDVPVSLLTQVLLNHVISGSLESTDLSTGYASTLATSNASGTAMSIYIDKSVGVRFNGVSSVATANITADNGVIHVVDAVIGLPTVVTFATADPEFATLVTALTRSDLTTDFVGILSNDAATAPAPFTVFAPNNQAFADLLAELQLTMLSEIDVATLDATLKTHVSTELNARESILSDGLLINTFAGNQLTANVTGGATLTDPTGRISSIIATDVQADNGVIHAINKVLLAN